MSRFLVHIPTLTIVATIALSIWIAFYVADDARNLFDGIVDRIDHAIDYERD